MMAADALRYIELVLPDLVSGGFYLSIVADDKMPANVRFIVSKDPNSVTVGESDYCAMHEGKADEMVTDLLQRIHENFKVDRKNLH